MFYLDECIDCWGEGQGEGAVDNKDTKLSGSVSMIRQEKNKRLYNLRLSLSKDDEKEEQWVYEIP